MDSRNRKSPHKRELNKTMSNPNLTLKKNKSRDQLNLKKPAGKDLTQQSKLKRRIEMMQTPQLLLKIHYKGKKLSVPLTNIEQRSLKELLQPNILRFEKEILSNARDDVENTNFDIREIENWKTVGKVDHLKDYYFQLDKPMSVFKGEVLEIEPIWRTKPPRTVQIKDFEIIKCIGTGGFSKVFLVRKKNNGKFYALKLMEKEGLLDSGKECVVTNERDIMVDLDNPYVLRMDYAFETSNFVAFALEYCPGGQLFYYLRKVKRMTEEEARYCFIQILVGFRYLHGKKIIYRDIKPQNIIIDHDGHLKIADFGLSKANCEPDVSAYTYCGSPQYMAPQMLNKSGHTFAVDYYCLGALLYELVTGNPPFYSRDVEKIYYSIQHEEIDFPSYVDLSPEIKMLLSGLLVKDPKRRLGSLGGIRQILAHPWVRKLKVTDVIERKVQTPIKVDLLTYNINEEELGMPEQLFQRKLRQEESQSRPFEPMFQDFYFARYDQVSICSVIGSNETSVPHLKEKDISTIINKQNCKDNTIQSHFNRDQSMAHNVTVGKSKKTLKKNKSKHKINDILVERARKRPDKSVKKEGKKPSRVMSPNPKSDIKGLKRIKSSGALRDVFR